MASYNIVSIDSVFPFTTTFDGQPFTFYCAYVTLDGTPDYSVSPNTFSCSKELMADLYNQLQGKVMATSYHVYNDSMADPTISDYTAETLTNENGFSLVISVNSTAGVTLLLRYNTYGIFGITTGWGLRNGVHIAMGVTAIDSATGTILQNGECYIRQPSIDGYATSENPNPYGINTDFPWPVCPLDYFAPETFVNRSANQFFLRLNYETISEYNEYVEPSTDPYGPGGESETGGGTGTFDETTEPVPVPDIPTTSAVDTGFISLYNPSITQLKALATYLWSPNGLDLDAFKKIFSDAMSAILGLSLIPLAPGAGTVESVVLGNINTGVNMPRISSQFIKYNCGSLTIEEYWGGYLDYSPYTSAEIYLPFIGVKPLSIDDIMGKTISVWYLIDVLSGGCVACIDCAGSVLYQFIGQCACSIPVTGRDFSNVVNGVLGAIGSGLSGFSKGGISGGVLGAVGSLAGNVTSMKPHVEKSGNMGGMGGMLGVKTPYIILTRPRQALPANQNIFTGYPSYITMPLGECSGFTVVQDVHLAGFSATDEEKTEIERLLKEGVIL